VCGIVGIASHNPISNPEILPLMRDTMHHRGPDDSGEWWSPDRRVGLGHRRLAIIDLSPGGHQPMTDAFGQFCITFNGEIYNYQELRRDLEERGHRFQTASDTEVILEAYRAWGVDCVKRFNGMFAFSLYDSTNERLFLGRDRAGEKPFFYHHAGGCLTFASELKALMANPAFAPRLDTEALDFYLAYGYVPGEKCILKGVRKLLPGHTMTYDLRTGGIQIWGYWQLPEPNPSPVSSAAELEQELEKLLLNSVRLRLIADVPLGILLSGGLDSSLITAAAARVSSTPVKTFTITFPGHSGYDEGPYARQVASHFGTQHTELAAEPATVELIPKLAWQYDEPIADSAIVPVYLVSCLIRSQAKVALAGDGGDELFGGYNHYPFLQTLESIRALAPRPMRRCIGSFASGLLPLGMKGRHHLIGFGSDLNYSIAHVNLYFDARTRQRLLAPLGLNNLPAGWPEAYKMRLCRPGYSVLQQATRVDFQTTMVDAYLVKVDRASMLKALEVRVPWLDHQIIELAFGRVPDALRATAKERKILLRRLAQRWLPPGLDLKRKQGFTMPLAAWFKGEWGHFIESVLREADPALFDRRVIDNLIASQHRGYANTERLFALTLFELWRREYRVTTAN
jgi:asparagine synthase (glutamine-hydrolysing)